MVAWASVMAGGVVVLLLAVALAVVCQPSLIDRLPSAGLRAALTTLANLGRRGAGKGAYAVAGANGEGVGVAAAGYEAGYEEGRAEESARGGVSPEPSPRE